MKRSFKLAASLSCVGLLATGPVHADVHFGIIATNRVSDKTTASITMATDVAGLATFTVFKWGEPEYSGNVGFDFRTFQASSANATEPGIKNLFDAFGTTSAVVRAVFPTGSSSALLEQSSGDGKIVLAMPRVDRVRGAKFYVPIGADLQQKTTVIVGNTSDIATAIVVAVGNQGEQPPRELQPYATLEIDVTTPSTMLTITSANQNVSVICVLKVDSGKSTNMTYLYPP